MISQYLQEQKRYTLYEVSILLNLSVDKTVNLLNRLKSYNIVKIVKASSYQLGLTDLIEEDIESAEADPEAEYYYVFTFVGVIVIYGRLIKCYPKYLTSSSGLVSDMKLVLRVLEKYNAREQIVSLFLDNDITKSFNLLAVMLSLLKDYHENGSYSNTHEIVECNGSGEILWDKTINETFALLTKDQAYYFDLQTRKRIQDEQDYFHRLHKCILTIISKELNQTELPDLFDIATVNLSDEQLTDFGDTQYILDQIEKELSLEFNTRKQIVLKSMYSYISRFGHLEGETCLALFGTNSFHLVWEHVCAKVLNNQLYLPLGSIFPSPVPDSSFTPSTRLIDIIDKPVWKGIGFTRLSQNTLIPDIVTTEKDGSQLVFFICDAKYYVLRFEPDIPLAGQPGIESITKQYLYQLAYKKLLNEFHITNIINCFLMPIDDNQVVNKGSVFLPMMDSIGLERIKILMIPANVFYKYYIEERHIRMTEYLA